LVRTLEFGESLLDSPCRILNIDSIGQGYRFEKKVALGWKIDSSNSFEVLL